MFLSVSARCNIDGPKKALLTATVEYLISVQHLLNVHNGKLDFIRLAKKDNLMLLNFKFKTFSINLNAQQVNGMTPFDLTVCTVIRYSRVWTLLIYRSKSSSLKCLL